MQPGSLLIDSSTTDPEDARTVAALSKESKAAFIDAPVSGGKEGREGGREVNGEGWGEVGGDCTDSSGVHCVLSGVGAAKKGILTFLVGGEEEDFQRAGPLLKCMGKNVIHCGHHGNGQAAKICNNMLLAIGMIGTSEALQLALR